MNVKVLGTGCSNCKKMKALVADVAAEMKVDITIEEVTDVQDILSYGVMQTPGIVINETLIGSGGVPSKEQMRQILQGAMA
jgi:small redox-active disulfide protein 2